MLFIKTVKKLFRIATVPESLDILLRGQLRYLNQFYKVTAISSPGAELDQYVQREGLKSNEIDMQRAISPLRDLVSLWNLYRYFQKEKPDIVHSITPKAGLLAMMAARLAGVPVRMHTFTGLIFPYKTGILKYILILMDRLLCACATHIYPEGKGVKEDLERYNITSKNLKIIANGNVNGIDLHHFDRAAVSVEDIDLLRERLAINLDDFVFIFLGRIVKDKGVNELISAFKSISELSNVQEITITSERASQNEKFVRQPMLTAITSSEEEMLTLSESYFQHSTSVTGLNLRNRLGKIIYRYQTTKSGINPTGDDGLQGVQQIHKLYPNVKLLMVGALDEALNPILGLTRAEIDNNPHIISTGFVTDVRPYLALGDCLVLPSYREGFPNAVLQAGAMGLPSIVSDINGCNEIITNGINGLIIPAKSEEALKNAMLQLLNDCDFTKNLQQSSRQRIKELYSHQHLWDELLLEYTAVLNKSSAVSRANPTSNN